MSRTYTYSDLPCDHCGRTQTEPQEPVAADKKQIWVYLRDARNVGLLTNYLNKAQPDVFAEVLRKTLMERVALEQAKAAEEDAEGR